MTVEELGLPPRFEEAMKRRLGRLGIFIEVNGKYYLSEERLKQIEELRSGRGETGNPRKRIMTLRLFQLGTVIFFVTLLLVSIFVQNSELRQYLLVASVVFMAAWILITILQIHYLSRARKRFFNTDQQRMNEYQSRPMESMFDFDHAFTEQSKEKHA